MARSAVVISIVLAGAAALAPGCGGSTFQNAGGPDASLEDGGDGQSGGSGGSGSSSSASGSSGQGTSSGAGSSGSASSGSSASGGRSSSSGASTSGGGSSGSGGSSGGASSSGGGSSSSSGGGACSPACGVGRTCCGGQCVNTTNDPLNCGGCGVRCDTGRYCNGSCQLIPCSKEGGACPNGQTCCGSACCSSGQLCCEQSGPVSTLIPVCTTPTGSPATCPQGCAPLCMSDRSLKRDIEPVDEEAVLEGVAGMPISRWSYRSDDPSVRHLGPMAQDFHAAFGLGATDRAYDPIDAHGVELAAIKALYERLRRDEAVIERLERENQELRVRSTCGP